MADTYTLTLTKAELGILLALVHLGMDVYRDGIMGNLAKLLDDAPKAAFETLSLKIGTLGGQANG